MIRVVACFSLVATLVLALIVSRNETPSAKACTGGFYGDLEMLAEYPNILTADVVQAGDATNRAPTSTPTNTATATRAFAEGTPAPTPASPPVANLARPTSSVPFDVTGFGATLRIIETYAGELTGTLEIDTLMRASVEREAREQDNGVISSCEPGQFAYRYRNDATYLVFAGEYEGLGLTTFARFEIAGDMLLVADPDYVGMSQDTHDRFFPEIAFQPYDQSPTGAIMADVPLSSFLGAVAYLRGGGSISPPETGSAGLR